MQGQQRLQCVREGSCIRDQRRIVPTNHSSLHSCCRRHIPRRLPRHGRHGNATGSTQQAADGGSGLTARHAACARAWREVGWGEGRVCVCGYECSSTKHTVPFPPPVTAIVSRDGRAKAQFEHTSRWLGNNSCDRAIEVPKSRSRRAHGAKSTTVWFTQMTTNSNSRYCARQIPQGCKSASDQS